jgi:ubiquinone/menaquinone biosynthesis C-methylase UbiE
MANLAPGGSVVDIACGTGLVTLAAAHTVAPGGKVLGTDISDDMLAIARATAGQQGIANCTFKRMDAEDLGFESGTFDVALCALGLMYAPDPEGAVAERHRVLKPSGRAVSAV